MTRLRPGGFALLGALGLLVVLTLWSRSTFDRVVRPASPSRGPVSPETEVCASDELRSATSGDSRGAVRPTDEQGVEASARCPTHSFSVLASEVGTGLPVEGATVELLVRELPRNRPIARVRTDVRGAASGEFVRDSSPADPSFLVRITHPSMLALGSPLRLATLPDRLDVRLATRVRLAGRVLDPRGWPVPGALIALGHPSMTGELVTQEVARTDEAGAFSVDRAQDLAPGTHLFAMHPEYPPAYADLDLEELGSTGSTSVVLQFEEGAHVELRVVDTEGRAVPDCRVAMVSARHPRLDYGPTFVDFPAHRSGVKSLRGVTNADGVFESSGWPRDEELRVFVLGERDEGRAIASIRPGRTQDEQQALAEVEGGSASILVTILRIPKVEVSCRGMAVGSGSEDRAALRLVLEDGRGVRWGAAVDWRSESEFEATFRIDAPNLRQGAKYHVVDRSPGGDARIGPFEIDGPTDLGSILLRR